MQQHSLGHVDCPACEGATHAVTMFGLEFGARPFPEAAALWLDGRKKLSPRSRQSYREYIATLSRFFSSSMRLDQIGPGHIETYQRQRQAEVRGSRTHAGHLRSVREPDCDGASLINHELSCLGQVLDRAGLRETAMRFYEPLPLKKVGPGIALEPDEEEHLFKVARSRPRWQIAYYCSLLSRSSSAGPGEIKGLRLGDVELDHPGGPLIHVTQSLKTEFRRRPLPLNPDALKAVEWMLNRARACGAHLPEHYLLPHRARARGEGWDPSRPMGSWKRAHRAMCAEAGKKFPRIARLRPYDFRHTAGTDLMERPEVSWSTVEHILGHRINSKTKRVYDHVRNQKLREAAEALHHGHIIERPIPQAPPAEPALAPPRFAPAPAPTKKNIGFGAVLSR